MPHVSRRKLSKTTEQGLRNSLHVVLAKMNSKQEADLFLTSLLSDTEHLMLAKRLAIIVMLREKIPESSIADSLHVTRETVSRIQTKYLLSNKGYLIALRKLSNEKYFQEFKKLLLSLAGYSIRAAGGHVKVSKPY